MVGFLLAKPNVEGQDKVSYDLTEHRHRFAVWAAARAAQRGFTTVKEFRRALQATDIQRVLASPETLLVSAVEFEALHRRWCSSICASLTEQTIANVAYGRAAKLVAVYLKTTVIMGGACDSPLGRNAHPPIDRVLLQGLARSPDITSPHKAAWKALNWTQLDEAGYYELMDQLRGALPHGAPFWTIEEYWQPSDSA